jgi:hypothetical protein
MSKINNEILKKNEHNINYDLNRRNIFIIEK